MSSSIPRAGMPASSSQVESVAQIVGPVGVNPSKVMAAAGDRTLVDTAEVVARQHRPRPSGDPVAAARAGEDEG